jgi:hypothetical protein
MTGRLLHFIVDPDLASGRASLVARIAAMADEIGAPTFPGLLDGATRSFLQLAFDSVGADEGSVWIAEGDGPETEKTSLVAAYNTGPHADAFVGKFRQPLGRGVISLVYASATTYCENEVYRSQSHDGTLDGQLEQRTYAMVATPLYFAGELRGVLTCVQLVPAGAGDTDPAGFSGEDARALDDTAVILERLIDHRLMNIAFGAGDA